MKPLYRILSISIHSLVKRETEAHVAFMTKVIISIHSLVKRETDDYRGLYSGVWYFNPLPRKEGDNTEVYGWEAAIRDFNPLPRKEGDPPRNCAFAGGSAISIHSLVKRETERR